MSAQVRLDAVIVAAGPFLTSPDIGFRSPVTGRPVCVVVIDVAIRTARSPLDADDGHRAVAVTRSRAIQARRASARSGQMEAKRTRRTCGPTTRTVSRLSALPDFTTSSHIRVARGWLIRTTGRLRPGRSWHNRRCDRDREITGSSRRDLLNTSSRMRHCQEFPGTQAQPQPACRDPAAAL